MSVSYRVSPAAQEDLDGIWDYLAEKNLSAASKLFDKLGKAFLLLAQNPRMGRARDELLAGLRSHAVEKYLIFYKPCDEPDASVEIIRVLHGARDIPAQFE